MKKALVALFAMACMALAEPHTHDGFFMNYAFGAGYQDFDIASKKGYDLEISGVSTEFDLKIGLSINPHIIVHLSLISVDNPNDIEVSTSDGDVLVGAGDGVSSILLGVGVTHYMVNNIFVTASVGAVQFGTSEEAQFDFKDGEHGLGFEGGIGKEIWISDDLGLGLELSLTYARSTVHGIKSSGLGLNLLLTLTYN